MEKKTETSEVDQEKPSTKKIEFQETKAILDKDKESGKTDSVGVGFDDLVGEAKGEGEKSPEEIKPPARRMPARKKKKTTRGKSPASTPASKEPEPEYVPFAIFDKNLMKIIAGMIPFSILATFANNGKYLLTNQEKETLALMWDAVADKYMPDIVSSYGVEFTLLSTIGLFLVSKSGVFEGKQKSIKVAEKEHSNAI